MKRLPLFLSALLLVAVASAGPGKPAPHEQKVAVASAGPGKPAPHEQKVTVRFAVYADDRPVAPQLTYRNHAGEDYQVQRLRFYCGKFTLTQGDSVGAKADTSTQYFLYDLASPEGNTFSFNAQPGKYNRITFLLGVDSADQAHGARTGALDPTRGMFWTWNSGFVTAKLEGESPASTLPGHEMVYHIGGFRDPYQTTWYITVGTINDDLFTVADKPVTLQVTCNLNNFFDGDPGVRIANTPSCTAPGALAKQLTGNFSNIFVNLDVVSAKAR